MIAVFVAVLALIGVAASPVLADCQRSSEDIDVAIGLRTAPPFIWSDSVGDYHGLIDDLWSSIERELQEKDLIGETEFVDCPLGMQLAALAEGDLDLVISPLTITAERMETIDFSHQYLASGITVAFPATSAIDLGQAFTILYDTLTRGGVPLFIVVFLSLNLVLALYMARALRYEADYNQTIGAEPRPFRFFRYVLEAISRTSGLRGMSDGLRSTTRTALEFVVAIIGTIFAALIFGVLTTALIESVGGRSEIQMKELPVKRVATLANSTSQVFLADLQKDAAMERAEPAVATVESLETAAGGSSDKASQSMSNGNGIAETEAAPEEELPAMQNCVAYQQSDANSRCVTTTTWREAMEIVARGGADVVLGDWAQLTYLSRLPEFDGDIVVQSKTFRLEPYGWGVSPSRPDLRAAIDQALIRRKRSPKWRELVSRYLGTDRISPE